MSKEEIQRDPESVMKKLEQVKCIFQRKRRTYTEALPRDAVHMRCAALMLLPLLSILRRIHRTYTARGPCRAPCRVTTASARSSSLCTASCSTQSPPASPQTPSFLHATPLPPRVNIYIKIK